MTPQYIYISAWNDSGGGFLHRLFDGHPQIRCYPFEVQLGTGICPDGLADWFHVKYRWPTFSVDMSPQAIFSSIINEELWDSLRNSQSSKFRDFQIDLDVPDWQRRFAFRLQSPLSVGEIVHAYLDTFFETWRDRRKHDSEVITLGHCPVLIIDWDRISRDDPGAKMINVIRSPFTGFVDMRRRHPALDPELYARKWSLITTLAFTAASKDADRFRILEFSGLINDRAETMRNLATWLDLDYHTLLLYPSWNGLSLKEPGPFGGVPSIGVQHESANLALLEPETIDTLARVTETARALFNLPTP